MRSRQKSRPGRTAVSRREEFDQTVRIMLITYALTVKDFYEIS